LPLREAVEIPDDETSAILARHLPGRNTELTDCASVPPPLRGAWSARRSRASGTDAHGTLENTSAPQYATSTLFAWCCTLKRA
jgi:hypothetical protein